MLIILLVVELLLFIVVIIVVVVFVVIQLNHGPPSLSACHAHYTARGRVAVIIVVVAANL